jgi:uncharacterized membrane protein YsdA (DUF1294 family)
MPSLLPTRLAPALSSHSLQSNKFMNLDYVLVSIFLALNLTAFIIMGNDKRKSMQGGNIERTPEGFLFFLASAFGATGIYLGMFAFRHKTKRWYFQLGIPLLILENVATLYFLKQFLAL